MAPCRVKVCVCVALVLLVLVVVLCVTFFHDHGCPDGSFRRAAVAADSRTCSEVGRDILKLGGSAVDSAIAALLCTSVIHPQSMGVGGGSIFTIRDASGKVQIINARETVPKNFNPELLKKCTQSFQSLPGTEWIGVPGEVRAYEEVHRQYGKLPWASLFQPTIKMAREGIPLSPVLARFLYMLQDDKTLQLRKLFTDKNGKLLKEGDTLRFEKLADTLEVIAEKGADAFYTGEIARSLISDIKDAGGILSLEDLNSFEVSVTSAWKVPLGDFDMYIPPPPAGGATLSFILNTMRGYNLSSESLRGKQKTLTFHRYVETCKFANGLKKFLRDPRFGSEREPLKMTQEGFAMKMRALISSSQTYGPQHYNVTPYLDSWGTTHLSVLAEDGSAVSVTSTINHIFGSRLYSPKTGILLNNELSDFCGKVDQIQAGERPPSSMSPAILFSRSKKDTIVIGGSGGSMITTALALTIMNHLWFGKSLEEAISAPVVFVDSKNALNFEPNFDMEVVQNLKDLGHTVEVRKTFFNVINGISKEGSCIHAVSDARKLGKSAGY
ncbi:glutathione hydrolase 5 proenzyme-like isoform X2 [Denticeps clupeoides]|uniref:Glutathione hydrolase n=1 Tax=Denticeps clupeoides TaxID=299321 RepID=A0AAY4CHN0_9TELE|nr:glutathione hydrolase 5 proenzyme-like isoform X2 [Denticeps clupeoides]